MPAGSPVVSSNTTARKGTLSSPKTGTGASRKSSPASIVRRMGALCTSRRCGPKKRASASGNARNVTRSARMGRFQVRQPLPANAVPTFSAKSCNRILSAKIVGTALVRLCPRLHPDGQFQPDSKSAFRQQLAVNNLPPCPYALLRRDNHHLLPRPPLPFHQDACTVRTHVFGQRPLFRHAFVLRTNLYGHCLRNPLFVSASRHWHSLPRLFRSNHCSLSCRWATRSPLVRLQFRIATFLRVRDAICMTQQFTESEGSLSHLRIERLAPRGQTQARSLCGHLRRWIAVARLAANWVETVILQRVNCVVRLWTVELTSLQQDPEGWTNAEARQAGRVVTSSV